MRKSFTYEGQRYFIRCSDLTDFEVKKALKIKELESNARIVRKNVTVKEWAKDWATTFRPDVDEKYNKHMTSILTRFSDVYGSYPLNKIVKKNIQLYFNEQTDLAVRTKRKHRDILANFFDSAIDSNIMLTNPVKNIAMSSRIEPKSRRPLTDNERAVLLKVAEYHEFGTYLKIMLYCGLRTMEVAALQGKDVDLKEKLIHVNSSIGYKNVRKEPKSKSGIRTVPIPDVLYEVIKDIKVGPFESFLTYNDKFYTYNGIQRNWKSFKQCMQIEMEQANLKEILDPDLVMYNLRHTYCTDLQEKGVPINIAKELMGHSSITVTAKIYTHSTRVSVERARQLINEPCHHRASNLAAIEK